jgi:hypothetical protein
VLLFFAAPEDDAPPREVRLRDIPLRDPPRFAALPRFAVLFFAVLFFAAPRVEERFDALFVLLRFAVPFFAPERLRIAGPRRVLFFPALRFVPRPDFFVAIAAFLRRK